MDTQQTYLSQCLEEPSTPIPMSSDKKQNVSPTETVLVAHCSECRCNDARFTQGPHLLVHVFSTQLKRENAVAISYALGDFDRQPRLVGHFQSNAGESAYLILGSEWDALEVQNRLSELSRDYGAVWIDQFCIPQSPEEIQVALGMIPSIYGTFDVLVLLPGSLCTCLQRELEEYQRGGGYRTSSNDDFDILRVVSGCWNAVGFSSHYSRVWTQQESHYAQKIRVLWSSSSFSKCLKITTYTLSEIDINTYLNSYAREFVRHKKYAVKPIDVVDGKQIDLGKPQLIHLQRLTLEFVSDLILIFIGRYHQGIDTAGLKYSDLARFLLGEPQQISFEQKRMDLGKYFCGLLKFQSRIASKKSDYVLAIWPQFPHYIVPDTWREFGLLALLEDAISQYESNMSLSVMVTSPAGLFRSAQPSALWRPSLYLAEEAISNAKDVYGVCTGTLFERSRRGYVPIQFTNSNMASRRMSAVDYFDSMRSLETREVVQIMRRVVSTWSRLNPLLHLTIEEQLSSQFNASTQIMAHLPLDPSMKDAWSDPEVGRLCFIRSVFHGDPNISDLPDIDHYEVVFGILARYFHLDLSICKAKGLRLMVVIDEPSYLGFYRRTPEITPARSENFAIEDQRQNPPESISVNMTPEFQDSYESVVYEAIRVVGEDDSVEEEIGKRVPAYTVVGVWATGAIVDEERIGARLSANLNVDFDAVLA